MKYLVLLCDGMADTKNEKFLNGKTPMELADKPYMDALAKKAELGLCRTVADGLKLMASATKAKELRLFVVLDIAKYNILDAKDLADLTAFITALQNTDGVFGLVHLFNPPILKFS